MDSLAFWLTVVSIVVTVVGIVVGIMTWKRRRAALHWTTPSWNSGRSKVGAAVIPTLTPRWQVRGTETIHGVECAVHWPGGPEWRVSSWPGGKVTMNMNLYVHINMLNGHPFTATISSPADHGKPVTDRTAEAVKGEYRLRIRWHESATPKKQREKIFRHKVT